MDEAEGARMASESPATWEHRCGDGVGGCTAISVSVHDWPIVVVDKPLRCGVCDGPIGGVRDVAVSAVLEAVRRHIDDCPGVRAAMSTSEDGRSASREDR